MVKRITASLCLALSVGLPLAADEAELLGVWAVDTAALRSQMERLIEGRLGALPETQRRPERRVKKELVWPRTCKAPAEAITSCTA